MNEYCTSHRDTHTHTKHIPSMLQRLDVEAHRWGDRAHVLPVEFLQDGCFPCVVQTSAAARLKTKLTDATYLIVKKTPDMP